MDILIALLINIVYGFLFFVAFGVLIGTTFLFAYALWDTVGRRSRGAGEEVQQDNRARP